MFESHFDNDPPGMIGIPPSQRVRSDPSHHAALSAHEWQDVVETYAQQRMRELGIPKEMIGAEDPYRRIAKRAFEPDERTGGHITTGITINSGILNPELLKGQKGGRIWSRARLRDRIDAIIAHEWEEDRHSDHDAAVKQAPKTKLPISVGAKRILKAMAR